MQFKSAAVLGTGMMGPGIAGALARGGVPAVIVGRTAESAKRGLYEALRGLRQLAENGLLASQAAAQTSALLSSSSDFDEAVRGVDLVVESIPEDMALKQELLARLEALCRRETVLASNTSGLSITAMASRCSHPERVVTTHFWNPPHLMPLVEIVSGGKTSPDVAEAMRLLWTSCGKVPVMVKKDRPGQLGNRMQMALVREAANIVAEGIATAADVDTAAKLGFGLRLPAYGVLEHQDMVGLVLGRAVCDYVASDLNNEPRAPRIYDHLIAQGATGAAAGRGFHEWPAAKAQAVRDRRDQWLIECLQRGITSRE